MSYANAFIATLVDQLNGLETKEIKSFLSSLVESTTVEGQKIDSNVGMWGAENML